MWIQLLLFLTPIVALAGVEKLSDRISAVAPIEGVSVGRKADKSTWRVDFKPEATPEQRSNAASIVTTFTEADFDPPMDRRARKYVALVDTWTHAIVRYQARLTDPDLTAQQKAKIQTKLDAAIRKVQVLSTQIENEDPD